MKYVLLALFLPWLAWSQQVNPHGTLDMACSTCHSTAGWSTLRPDLQFDHATTGFALQGGHSALQCGDCHQNLNFAFIGHACADCHADIHRGELGLRCENCHTPQNWDNRREALELHAGTRFPLLGLHASLDCQACHGNAATQQEFALTPVECKGCHLETYMSTLDPQHELARFSLDCAQCHNADGVTWQRARYTHPQTFALDGAHKQVDCVTCHESAFAGTNDACEACHMNDFEQAANPDHSAFRFPTVCEQCHTTMSWDRDLFDHTAESGFELIGAHSTAFCISCHVNNRLTGLARDCIGCHESDFNQAQEPDHVAAQLPQECLQCHNQQAWQPATFDHAQTAFVLTGAHAGEDCQSCHLDGIFTGTPTDCWSCHQPDYEQAADPNHVAGQFGQDCATCHTTTAWEPATFDHSRTNFVLTGAHLNTNCQSCHIDGVFAGTPSDCWSCHEPDYNQASDPDHVTNQFDQDCATCHSTTAWSPADFDHTLTAFPLTGAHVLQDCQACHADGYNNTPTECFACHEDDFNTTTDPPHGAAGFPQTCAECHNTTAWEPANWDHDAGYFPIYSGEHREEWDVCADCHVDPANYSRFECINCHEHNRNEMDDKHREVSGYVYESTACFDCHPDGRADDDLLRPFIPRQLKRTGAPW